MASSALAQAPTTDPATLRRDRPGEVMPDRAWDVHALDLRVRVDVDARSVSGTATHDLVRLDPGASHVTLHQVALDIDAVRVDGEVVDGWHAGLEHITVPVPGDATTVSIGIDYHASPDVGLHFRGGPSAPYEVREAWSQGEGHDNRHWYPGWDYPNDRFVASVAVEAPPGLNAVANGSLQGKETLDDGWTRWSYHLDAPIVNYLVAVVVGDHRVVSDTAPRGAGGEPLPLEYIGRATDSAEMLERTLGRTAAQLTWFEAVLDSPYPYPIYRQALVQRFMYGGMENATLTTLNDDRRLFDAHEPPERADSVIAHELAHQWFGDHLTCYGWRELWLNEGFATFYAGLWQQHAGGSGHFGTIVHRWHDGALNTRDAPMAARAHTQRGDDDNAAVYTKGASVLQMLRVHLGESVFDAAIQRYVAEHGGRLVETEDLRRVLEDTSGKHLGWLFDQWVTGTGIAELTSRHAWTDGQLEVIVEQVTAAGAFSAPVGIEIGWPDGGVDERTVWIEAGRALLQLDAATAPSWVAIDPAGGVLADWSRDQPPAAWIAQAQRSPHAYARLTAIEALGQGPALPEVIEALSELATDTDTDRWLRVAAIDALVETQNSAAVAPLLIACQSPDLRLREAAVDGLGLLERDLPDVTRTLQRVMRTDPAPRVRASALLALAELDGVGALPVARKWLDGADASPGEYLHEAAADVLGDHGGARDLAQLTAAIDPRRARRGRLTQVVGAAAKLVAELDLEPDDPARQRLARRVEPLLDSEDVRIRSRAIPWLGAVGDDQTEALLLGFAGQNRVTWGELSDRALDAAHLLRRGGSSGEPSDAVDDDEVDLEAMQARLDELARRLDDLETWH